MQKLHQVFSEKIICVYLMPFELEYLTDRKFKEFLIQRHFELVGPDNVTYEVNFWHSCYRSAFDDYYCVRVLYQKIMKNSV